MLQGHRLVFQMPLNNLPLNPYSRAIAPESTNLKPYYRFSWRFIRRMVPASVYFSHDSFFQGFSCNYRAYPELFRNLLLRAVLSIVSQIATCVFDNLSHRPGTLSCLLLTADLSSPASFFQGFLHSFLTH